MASKDSILESVEEMDDSPDSGSDFEVELKAKKRGKMAVAAPKSPKRPRRKAALSVSSRSSSIPTSPDSSLQQRPPGRTSGQASARPVTALSKGSRGITAADIYDAVCSGKTAMVTVVDEWLDSYKQSREAGLLVLINFLVRSCGCKGVVSREMLDSMQNAEIIGKLTKEFNEDSVNYPLCTPGPQLKHFKAGLCEFVRVLVRLCQHSLIYDEYLFPLLLALLTGLSDSQVRAFRHTSTLIAMKVMTGLVEVAVVVSVQLQTTQRQHDLENSKGPHDQAPGRLEELQATVCELRENREELSCMMNATFRGVFVHRYRDQLSDIRATCIEELGMWLQKDPEDFLNDGCIKYLGWTLYDKQSPVRLRCVRALQALYQEKEFIGRLELFTSRFKERMLSMVLDKDPEVAVEVVNLLLLLQQNTEEGLTEEECGHIYPLVYALNPALASAAGVFLFKKLKTVLASDHQESDTSENAGFFQILISFFLQSENPTMKNKKVQEQVRSRITSHFIPLLPRLLAKYSPDAEKVSLLLKAPLYFSLEMYSSTAGLEKHLDLLLSQVSGIIEKHTDATVLEACGTLVSTLCDDRYTFSPRTNRAFSQLMDGLTEHFNAYLSDLLQGTADDDDVYTAASALKRIAALSSAMDLTGCKLFDSCLELLKSRIESSWTPSAPVGELDEELMVSALRCAAFYLMWAKVNAVNSTPAEEEMNRLKKEMRSFCRVCETCLSLNQKGIRDQTFELLCDLLLLYSASSAHVEPDLQALVCLPSDSLRSEMASFLLDYIFSDSEAAELDVGREEAMKITLLQRRRNQLAGYCKMVLYGVLDLTAATNVFKHYDKYFKDFGDIIKETVSKSKVIDPVRSARTVCLCLQQMFSEMLAEEPSQQDVGAIRNLAKRLAMSFGVDLRRARKPLVALHVDGVRFAFREPAEGEEQQANVAFLEILSEFSFKLLQQDRVHLAAVLKAECPDAALSWPSVRLYERSLGGRSSAKARVTGEGGNADFSHEAPAAKRKRSTPPVRGSWLDGSSVHSSLPPPAFTSTAQRQPASRAAASEPGSEDEFSLGSSMRKVKTRHQTPSSSQTVPTVDMEDINSPLNLLSLIDDDEENEEDPDIEDYESDFDNDSAYTLPSTRHTSASVLNELFD
uniref:cohesin subunit SA-1 isoform X3 n=1 Tax=Gasterosteus aculeatus aculeatus TaxID=481459 RepID=UPI001A981FFD|nr:cohesin subunit SA-1 isoform X3 [Gasterosteus aculeatus aculeatus]